jgi:hypothetical protein
MTSANSFGGASPNLRIDHNADGTYVVRADQAKAQELFGDQGDIKHTIKGNFVWQLPMIRSENTIMRAIGLVANDWQLSGIFTLDSGNPFDVGYSYQSGGGTNLTGSPDYNARIIIPDLGLAGGGCSDDQYSQFNNKMVAATSGTSPVRSTVFSGPSAGSAGSSLDAPVHGVRRAEPRPGDSAQHQARRRPHAPAARRRVQRAEHRGLHRTSGHDPVQLADRPDGAQFAVPRRRVDRSEPPDAEHGRVRRRQRRGGSAIRAGSDPVHVLDAVGRSKELSTT